MSRAERQEQSFQARSRRWKQPLEAIHAEYQMLEHVTRESGGSAGCGGGWMRRMLLCCTLCLTLAWLPADGDEMAAARAALDRFQLDEVGRLLDAAGARGASAEALYLQSRRELLGYRFRRAIELSERCVELFSDRSICYESLGEGKAFASLDESGPLRKVMRARSALADLKHAVELDPANVRPRILLIRFYTLAPWILGGSKGKALEQSQAIARLDPGRASEAYGMMYYYHEQWDIAHEELRKALVRRPGDGELRYHAARARGKLGDRAGAVEELIGIVKSNPQLWEAWYTLGTWCVKSAYDDEVCLWALGEFIGGAVDAHGKRMANAYYWLGQLRERRGEFSQALLAYERALEVRPGHDESNAGVARVRRIVSS